MSCRSVWSGRLDVDVFVCMSTQYCHDMLDKRECLTLLVHEQRVFWLVFTRESRMLRASLPSSGRPSVCPSVCHTRELYQNDAS